MPSAQIAEAIGSSTGRCGGNRPPQRRGRREVVRSCSILVRVRLLLQEVTCAPPSLCSSPCLPSLLRALGATRAAPRVVARIATGQAPCSEAGGYGALWVSNYGSSDVARSIRRRQGDEADPRSGRAPAGSASAPERSGSTAGDRLRRAHRPAQVEGDEACPRRRRQHALGRHVRRRRRLGHGLHGRRRDPIDPRTMRVVKRIKVGGAPSNLRFGPARSGSAPRSARRSSGSTRPRTR